MCFLYRLCRPVEHRDRWGAHPPLPELREDPGSGSEPGQSRPGLRHWIRRSARQRQRLRLLEDSVPDSATQDCESGSLCPHSYEMSHKSMCYCDCLLLSVVSRLLTKEMCTFLYFVNIFCTFWTWSIFYLKSINNQMS